MFRKISEDLMRWKDSPYRKPLILQGARQTGERFVAQGGRRTTQRMQQPRQFIAVGLRHRLASQQTGQRIQHGSAFREKLILQGKTFCTHDGHPGTKEARNIPPSALFIGSAAALLKRYTAKYFSRIVTYVTLSCPLPVRARAVPFPAPLRCLPAALLVRQRIPGACLLRPVC